MKICPKSNEMGCRGRTRRTAVALLAAVSVCALAASPVLAQSVSGPTEIKSPATPARSGAPNILVVLLDDVGFGASSTFGGPVPTPNYEALAAGGLKFNEFHTTAMCSPTRAALLTGRNPHRVNMGVVTNLSSGEPGYTGIIPKSAATIGRVLQLNGYNTAWFGKNHVTPEWEKTAAGPFDRWPVGLGFDYFYGFMNGATNQWSPELAENNRYIDPPRRSGYILDDDLTDHLIDWVQQHHSAAPDKPFFAYFASGSTHEPHQAPADWIARFKGKFDQGWDKVREETFARQKKLGIIPEDAVLTSRPAQVPAWASLSQEQKQVAARMMEVEAAQLAHFDDQFGRIVDMLKRTGQWDNTLVIYIGGDNGASAEGGPDGDLMGLPAGPRNSLAYSLMHLDDMGGPRTFENYPAGWGWAMDTPFQYYKQVASHLGGIRDDMVISWPAKIKSPGQVRSQFSYVTDVAATVYEAAGIAPPAVVDGVKQMPLDGVSLLYALDNPEAPSRHREQYFEMQGNRGFYSDGWMASTTPAKQPWQIDVPFKPLNQWTWQLYDLRSDYSQSKDLASANPEKLRELKAAFDKAVKDNGFKVSTQSEAQRGQTLRPWYTRGRKSFEFYASNQPISDVTAPNLAGTAWTLTADLTVSNSRTNGAIMTEGGWPSGWGLFVMNGLPTFLYRNEPDPLTRVAAERPLGPGHHVLQVRMSPVGRPGSTADVLLLVDGQAVAKGAIPASAQNFNFAVKPLGVGRDFGPAISEEYELPFKFEGHLEGVNITLP